MFTRPEDLDNAVVVEALTRWWDISVEGIEYQAVGFGSHHWSALDADGRRWFVTVDDLDAKVRSGTESRLTAVGRLRAALATARAVRDSGAGFVVAPIPARDRDVLKRIAERYALALYPFIEGRSHAWGAYESASDRRAVLELLAALHTAPPSTTAVALVDDFVVPQRDGLERALADRNTSWDGGPYSKRARALLSRYARNVEWLLAHHDRLADEARRHPHRMVLTHGEPHLANTIVTESGWMLIDWDTALIAPPERDLWFLASDDDSAVDGYAAATRTDVSPSMLDLYRFLWDLAEIAIYIALFRRRHGDTADVRKSWTGLNEYLDPGRGWPSPT